MTVFAGKAVLVVEDEPIIGIALEDELMAAGASVTVADSLEMGSDAIGDGAFDVAILDVNIHGEQSYSLAGILIERGVPVIFASGYGDRVHPSAFADVPTVTKPYAVSDLERAFARTRPG